MVAVDSCSYTSPKGSIVDVGQDRDGKELYEEALSSEDKVVAMSLASAPLDNEMEVEGFDAC